MMVVRELAFYLGRWSALKGIRRPDVLKLPETGCLCRQIHQDLLKVSDTHRKFQARIAVPEFRAIDLHWSWAGQTGGVMTWTREGKAIALSLYIACECPEARAAVAAATASCRIEPPAPVWDAIENAERPIIISLYFGMGHYLDPLLITACNDFGVAFFSMFGTNEE